MDRLFKLLDNKNQRWIDLQLLFTRWIGSRVNTFSVNGDHDVCYAAAREFFFFKQTPKNSGNARSTETIATLILNKYCMIPDDVEPRFGDLLYVAGHHAGRYILKDPNSGRGISFSIYSGGNVPYRFWWMDEDFSTRPLDKTPDPDVRKNRVDVWRRCKL